MAATDLILTDPQCRASLRIFKTDTDDLFNDAWLKVREWELKGNTVLDHRSFFFITARNIYLQQQRQQQPPDIVLEDYNPTPYQQALDNFLKKNDDIFSNVIKMYLLCPNLSKISRDTNIKLSILKQLLSNARSRIGMEYIKLSVANDCDYDTMV
jgi:hypothetical protein